MASITVRASPDQGVVQVQAPPGRYVVIVQFWSRFLVQKILSDRGLAIASVHELLDAGNNVQAFDADGNTLITGLEHTFFGPWLATASRRLPPGWTDWSDHIVSHFEVNTRLGERVSDWVWEMLLLGGLYTLASSRDLSRFTQKPGEYWILSACKDQRIIVLQSWSLHFFTAQSSEPITSTCPSSGVCVLPARQPFFREAVGEEAKGWIGVV